MTVSSETSRKTFTGNGVTTSFATSPMVFFTSVDLTVSVVNTATSAVVATLAVGTHFTLSGGAVGGVPGTGTLDLAAGSTPYGAPATGTTLVIVRDLAITQATDFVQNDSSDANVTEAAFDRITMVEQEFNTAIGRAFRLADTDVSGATLTLPDAGGRASKFLKFDAAGNLAVSDGTGTDTTLRADIALAGTTTGAAMVGFQQARIPTASHRAARTAQAKAAEVEVSVLDALNSSGAQVTGDGVVDDTTGIQRAIDSGKTVVFPEGYTFLTQGLTLGTVGQVIRVRGTIKLKNSTNQSVFTVNASRVKILGEGGEIDGNKANQTTVDDSLGSGVWIADGFDNVEVRDLYIHDCKRNGVAGFGNHDGCIVFGNRIVDCALMGVYPAQASNRPCKRWLISANEITGFGQDGIGTVAIQNSVISGNRIVIANTGGPIKCIALEAECNDTVVVGNTMEGSASVANPNGGGIQVNDSQRVTVVGNTFRGLSQAVDLHGAVAGTGGITVTANVAYDCGYAGWAFQITPTASNSDFRSSFTDNCIENSPYTAIALHSASHCQVLGNNIRGVNLQNTVSKRFIAGITLSAQAYYNTIANNVIDEGATGNMKIGIHENSTAAGANSGGNTIRDNRIIGADYDIVCGGTAYGLLIYSKVTRTSDVAVTAAPTTGHWERIDFVPNEQPAAAGAPGWVCTDSGTFGAQTATNASITSGQFTLTFANAADAAKFHAGMKIRVSGAGPAAGNLDTYISAFDGTGLACTVRDAAGTTTSTATVSCLNPTFKAMAVLAA